MKPVTDITTLEQLTTKPSAAKAAASPSGYNQRQISGANQVYTNTLNYVEALTGLNKAQLALMTPAQIEKQVKERGKRVFQGPVMGDIPLVSGLVNRDLEPYAMGAATGQALINNPTGPVTKPDVEQALVQQPNWRQPLPTQARLIRQILDQEALKVKEPTAPAGWSIKKVK